MAATVGAEVEVAAPVAAVWDLYFDPDRWPDWVDQFAAVISSDGYPDAGGTLRWRSGGAGRGEVTEKVIEHEPRRLHRITFSDPEAEGELATTFEVTEAGALVRQELTYDLRRAGPFARLADVFFVRAQMRASLVRSLLALRAELEAASGGAG
jgi:uncharacterized protein YndB with AHSA1/START domain